jgi:hypothetical protein
VSAASRETFDLLAHGGLREVQPFRRAVKAPAFSHNKQTNAATRIPSLRLTRSIMAINPIHDHSYYKISLL